MSGYWVWAAADLGRSFARYSRRSNSLADYWLILVLILAIPFLWIALTYWDKWRKQHFGSNKSPKSLFLELCGAHRLSRPESQLLLKAAEAKGLAQPATLFLDSTVLRELSESGSADAGVYRQLLQKLFGNSDSNHSQRGLQRQPK